jgi:hypothetical protein
LFQSISGTYLYHSKKEAKMDTGRKTAVIVGALFLISYAGVFIGSGIYGPIIDAPDYLGSVYPNRSQVIIGVLIELLNDIAVVGIAVMLFPLLKKQSEGIALGYVAFRVVEAVTLIVGKISVLSLITISQEYISTGDSYFQASGALALAGHYWVNEVMLLVFFILGALLFYYLLYQSRLLPRFIPIWGFIALATLLAGNVIGMPELTEGFHPVMLLLFPIMLNELFIGVWLIVKGFNPTSIIFEPA